MDECRVKLVRSDGAQIVSIPPELELPGDEVLLRAEGGRLVLQPVGPGSLFAYLASREPIDEEWPEIEDPPPEPVDL